ncbi:MAG: hypothetical protein AAGA23_03675 [Pseudomonadota bacterium]
MTFDLYAGVEPSQLGRARELSHAACQWPSKAARANLPAPADDSHSNLGWLAAQGALVSHPLDGLRRRQLAFRFSDQALLWLDGGEVGAELGLRSESEVSVEAWVDRQLADAGLTPTGAAEMPYALDDAVDYAEFAALSAEVSALGHWFQQADRALQSLITEAGHLSVKPAVARCWPHHFDLAVLFALETGDPESARSVGVGLSPGDGSYAEPYLYCSPWPPPAVETLDAAAAPFRWHVEGFVSLVAPASALDRGQDLTAVVREGFRTARRQVA